MVLPSEVIIKQEKEDIEDVNPNYDFKIDVKIESSQADEDWCSQSNSLFPEPLKNNSSDVVDYKTLIEDCLQLCSLCNSVFGDSYSLICHQRKHLVIPLERFTCLKYQCDHCLQYFVSYLILEEHILTHHLQTRKVPSNAETEERKPLHQCKHCSKKLGYKSWHSHEREVHCKKRFTCAMCRRKYCTLKHFKRHFLFVHCGIKRSGGYGHIRNAAVMEQKEGYIIKEFEMRDLDNVIHKKTTKTLAEVKCSQCPAVLANKHALKTHVRNCHCEKVTCEICKSVLKKSYLRNHMRRVHYNDGKEHKCGCGKKFRSPRYLKIHIKNAHNKRDSSK